MQLAREELLVLLAVVRAPSQPWRNIERLCCMARTRACAVRDSLIAARALIVTHDWCYDAMARRVKRERYQVAPSIDVSDLQTWLDTGMRTPCPIPPRPTSVVAPLQRSPGMRRDPRERLLETILRNPERAWREVRLATGLNVKIADAARQELLADETISGAFAPAVDRMGRRFTRGWLAPNEESSLVRELRKRYGIAIPAPVEPVPEWLAATRRALLGR